MLHLPLSLWLSFTPLYLSNMGTGTEMSANLGYELTKRASLDFGVGGTTAQDFKDRHGSLDLNYKLTENLETVTGLGYDRYDLYVAGEPTYTKDLHFTVKYRVF